MKNRYKIFSCFALSILLFTSCTTKKIMPYSIYFSGVGAVFQREVDYIYPKNDYSIGVCAIDNYYIDESDFTVEVNGVKAEPGDRTWHMSNNLLTIKANLITDNIDVSVFARPKELELNIINPDPRISFSTDKPYSGEDFNLHMNFDVGYGIKIKSLSVGKYFEFTNYTLKKEAPNDTKNYFIFSIDQKYLNGNINVEFELIEDYVSISNNLLELKAHDSGAIAYFFPNKENEYDVEVEVEGTPQAIKSISTSIDKTYNIVHVDVTNGFDVNDVKAIVNLKDNATGKVLNSALVNISNPSNVQDALDCTVLGIIKNNLANRSEGVPTSTFRVHYSGLRNYTWKQWDELMEIYGRTGAIYYDCKDFPDLRSCSFGCYKLDNLASKETTLKKGDENYLENLTNINYLNHKAKKINVGRPCYIENVYKRLVVRNSEELFWAVEHGYRPEFPSDGFADRVEEIYYKAIKLCQELTDDTMNKLQVARIFFEYLSKEIHYDYNLVEKRSEPGYLWYEHQGNFLESVFPKDDDPENPKMYAAVNEGLSKSFAFLCGIVGIPCFRTYGRSNDIVHSYNYVKIQGIWYLVCPTWCRIETEIPEVVKMYGSKVSLLDYTSFLNSKYFFTDYSTDYNYSDLLWQNEIRSKRAYSDAPITSLDFTVGDRTFYLQSTEDALALKKVIDTCASERTFVCLSYPTRYDDKSNEWNAIITSNYKGEYQIYHSFGEVFTQEWILFN